MIYASQVSRFEQLPTFALNSAYIRPTSQVPRFGQLLTLLCIILRMDIASWVPRLEQLLTAQLCSHPRSLASQVWRFERDSLSINMDFPTLMLRRHRTSSRYLYRKAVKAMGVHVLQVSYFGQLLFRAIALQTRELADTPNGFEGSSIAAIHSFALVDCRLSRNPIRLSWQLLRDHFGFVGHPLPRPQVEWIGVSIKIVSPLGTKLALF